MPVQAILTTSLVVIPAAFAFLVVTHFILGLIHLWNSNKPVAIIRLTNELETILEAVEAGSENLPTPAISDTVVIDSLPEVPKAPTPIEAAVALLTEDATPTPKRRRRPKKQQVLPEVPKAPRGRKKVKQVA